MSAQLGWKLSSASLGKGCGARMNQRMSSIGIMLKVPFFTLWCQETPPSPT